MIIVSEISTLLTRYGVRWKVGFIRPPRENFKTDPNLINVATVIWLKYWRKGIKTIIINQSLRQQIKIKKENHLIEWFVFYAVSAIFQTCIGGHFKVMVSYVTVIDHFILSVTRIQISKKNWLIDCYVCYVVSVIFQPCNGGD